VIAADPAPLAAPNHPALALFVPPTTALIIAFFAASVLFSSQSDA
jgi:hypothetical protein